MVTGNGNNKIRINRAELRLLPTRYRVTRRTVSDSSIPGTPVNSYSYDYEYDEAATNDPDHSVAVDAQVGGVDNIYATPYSQYRGNAIAARSARPATTVTAASPPPGTTRMTG